MSNNSFELQRYFDSLMEEHKELEEVLNYLRKRLNVSNSTATSKKPKIPLITMIFETLERHQIPMSTYEIWRYINIHFNADITRASVCSNLCNRRKFHKDIKNTSDLNWYPTIWDKEKVESTP